MITLFIVKSNSPEADRRQTVDSICPYLTDISVIEDVRSLDEINLFYKKTDWYMILYDNEECETRLAVALQTFIKDGRYDVLTLFKVESPPPDLKMSQSPRVFKSHITLADGSMQPEYDDYSVCAVQNGWITDL